MKKQLAQAVALFESFREKRPRKLVTMKVTLPEVVMVIGHVEGIDYRTTHKNKLTLYHHDFEAGSRPLLCASADGKQLLLIGGRYQFTDRGIVDKDAHGNLIFDPNHGKEI